MKLRLWLLAMDAVAAAERAVFRIGTAAVRHDCPAPVIRALEVTHDRLRDLYLWTVGKASDATDWGGPLDSTSTPDVE